MKKVFGFGIAMMLLGCSVVHAAGNFIVYGAYATNSSVNQVASNATVSYGVGGALALGGEYRFSKDWGVAVEYQTTRELSSSGVASGAKYSGLILKGNYFLSLSPELKLGTGLNYNLPNKEGTGWAAGITLGGSLGYHLGLEYQLASNFLVRGEYAMYRANVTFSNGSINGLEDSGFRVALAYQL